MMDGTWQWCASGCRGAMRLLLLVNRCQANEPYPCRSSTTSPGLTSSRSPSRSSYPTGAAAAWTSRSRAVRGRPCCVAAATHRYNAGPALAGREVAVRLGAFGVTSVDPSTDEVVATCPASGATPRWAAPTRRCSSGCCACAQAGAVAQADKGPRAQVRLGVRLVARAVPRGLGPRRHARSSRTSR